MIHEGKSKKQLISELEEALRQNEKIESLENQCERDEAAIKRQNEFFNLVIESLPYPFYVLDAKDYSIKIANPAARLGDLSSHPTCYGLTHRRNKPCEGPTHICPLKEIKRTKAPVTVEHTHYDLEGNPLEVEVHAFPIFDNEGNVVQAIEYNIDITERKKLELEIRDYANKIKLFTYSVSHDLKNPLIAINGLVNLLCKKHLYSLDIKGKTVCDLVLKSSKQVLTLIEDINQYIKTKEAPLHFEQLQVKEVLDQVRNEFWTSMTNRKIHWSEPENIPEVRADKLSLLRVFRNLVDNALKYGGEKLNEIKIGYEGDQDFDIFFVRDDGVGINKENFEKIFELFQRDSKSGVEGSGLGLAIVKEIVEKHNGKAWAVPGLERGVTFYFSISKK